MITTITATAMAIQSPVLDLFEAMVDHLPPGLTRENGRHVWPPVRR